MRFEVEGLHVNFATLREKCCIYGKLAKTQNIKELHIDTISGKN